nr:septal ring lytic transglycosylase RlpA family protein [Thalassotalea crassostreae]
MKAVNTTLIILSTIILVACETNSRYSQKHDSIPTRLPTAEEQIEPVPQLLQKSRGGNKKSYTVLGKSYSVMDSAEGYNKTGIASWYGNKFHGHLTSNGEIYDMYAFSAAHKSLPIPSYVQVTNVENNKSVIVRVNDRGPFHQDRLIDLSYSAAYKLGMLAKGTANVKIVAIDKNNIAQFTQKDTAVAIAKAAPNMTTSQFEDIKPNDNIDVKEIKNTPIVTAKPVPVAAVSTQPQLKPKTKPAPAKPAYFDPYIHVLVTRDKLLASNTAKGLRFLMPVPVKLSEKNELFRVQLGPIEDATQAKDLLTRIQNQGYPGAYSIKSLK